VHSGSNPLLKVLLKLSLKLFEFIQAVFRLSLSSGQCIGGEIAAISLAGSYVADLPGIVPHGCCHDWRSPFPMEAKLGQNQID